MGRRSNCQRCPTHDLVSRLSEANSEQSATTTTTENARRCTVADENIPTLRENFYECVYYIHHIKPFEILLRPLQNTTVVAIIDKFEDL